MIALSRRPHPSSPWRWLHLGALGLAVACGGSGGDATRTSVADLASAGGAGPVGIYLPEDRDSRRFPFPHDGLTTLDATSPTGRRLALPLDGVTTLETEIRALLDEEPGFDSFTPIQLSFDAPLALAIDQAYQALDKQDGARAIEVLRPALSPEAAPELRQLAVRLYAYALLLEGQWAELLGLLESAREQIGLEEMARFETTARELGHVDEADKIRALASPPRFLTDFRA